VSSSDTHRIIDAVWRIESARLIAGLARIVRDAGLAEELAQDALVAALERWPESGVPDNPGAWLMATAKHRAIDLFRRNKLLERKHAELGRELETQQEMAVANFDTANDDDIGDDLLRLVFIACHPVLSTEARVALTLRLMGGLTTQEIARAFLAPEPTVAQRIVRAKRTLTEARVPFEVPRGPDLRARLSSVLEVIYLIFNEGYSRHRRRRLDAPCALRRCAPPRPNSRGSCSERTGSPWSSSRSWRFRVRGFALESVLQESRSCFSNRIARVGIMSSSVAVSPRSSVPRKSAMLSAVRSAPMRFKPPSPHATLARARRGETDWRRIAALYDALAQLMPSPVVELNRAVALSMAFGPEAGLELIDTLASEPSLKAYHLLPSVRGDLLSKLGRFNEARAEFERAGHAHA